ncbi:MAG: RNA polymerase sigma factor [Sedimentisphaerales bacterium]|nr:RNA polymerase sigma factor [Sedimentisphaerales bacterium]
MLRKFERQILKGIREGEPNAFETVINEHYKSVFGFLAYLCRDTGAAEDLTQDTFAAAWANIGNYKKQASIKTWLHRIAYNKFLDSERKSKKYSAIETEFKEEPSAEKTAFNPLDIAAKDEYSRILYREMQKLKPDEYTVIVLHYIQNFSYKEIGNVLKEPVGTIKWRTNQALNKLREVLLAGHNHE